MNDKSQFKTAVSLGIPIALGYFSVSFAYGMMASGGGIPVWAAVMISMTNVTSAGQLAGTQLMLAGGALSEIAMTTLVINLRYFLMSLSLSQKVKHGTSLLHRLLFSFGITDEIFAVASGEKTVTPKFMYGLILLPYFGWAGGTLAGAAAGYLLPEMLVNALGIAIYGMFIAIIIPPCRTSKACLLVVLIAVGGACLLRYVPGLSSIPSGWAIIICAVTASVIGAILHPVETETAEEEESDAVSGEISSSEVQQEVQ